VLLMHYVHLGEESQLKGKRGGPGELRCSLHHGKKYKNQSYSHNPL